MMPFALWDKFLHFSAFALGGALLAAALHASFRWPWRRLALCAAAVLALFGASDEWHQLYTPNRSGADVYDWLADALGALTGAAGFLTAQLLRRGRADAA